MKPTDESILEKAVRKIESLMRKQSLNKLTIERKYLPEIFSIDLLEIYEGLPILKPFVELYFRSNGISVKFSINAIIFQKISSKEPTTENINIILKRLANNPEVKSVTIASAEGLPIASALPQGVNETMIAAMTAALHSLAERSIIEMKNGKFNQLYLKGSNGYLLILQVGPNIVLTISTTKDMKLGLNF